MADTAGKRSETTDADEDIQRISDQVKAQVEEITGKKYAVFRAVEFMPRLGMAIVGVDDYLIKVYVGDADYIYLHVITMVVQHPQPPKLEGVYQNKSSV